MSKQSNHKKIKQEKKTLTKLKRKPRIMSVKGKGYEFYCETALSMTKCAKESVSLTITSPPYWNAIDYDIHAKNGDQVWHRDREYSVFGYTFTDYMKNLETVFQNVLHATIPGGYCAIVIGTLLFERKHLPIPMLITNRLSASGWEFHQDIIWNKVTGGVKRAGTFIQHPRSGYFYPNIMTEYILVFRKPGNFRRRISKEIKNDPLFEMEISNNVWHVAPVPPNQIDHPCPYPEEIVRRLLLLYSRTGENILDPFLGSGQTALVAIKQKRKCIGFDIEKSYIKLAKSRIENSQSSRTYNLLLKCDLD